MDGLSAAASVAGIVSLGIQVAQGLVDFYSAYKSQKSDVAHTFKKLEQLVGVLETLRGQLADRADEHSLLKNIEGSIQVCEECINELQSEGDKFKDNSAAGIRAAARTAARRLEYPFRQSTLQKLDENVDEVVSHLSLTLQVLQHKDASKVQTDIEETKTLLELVRASQISSAIRNWLKAPDAAVNYYEACKKRHGGTGLWLVKSAVFSAWLTNPNSFLWLNGFAGCGKSVLCSTAIQHAFRHRRSNPRIGIAFFFFTFNDNSKQDTSTMLRALVLQLSGQLGDSHELLSQLYQSYRDTTPPDQALMGCLIQLVRAFKDTYIILDALDESPRDGQRRSDVLQALVDLRALSEPGLYLLVTSREEPDIRERFLDEFGALRDVTVFMKNDSVDSDIASFISGSLRSDRRLRKWEKYHDQIKEVLTARAKGVFRWVECQFTALDSCAKSKSRLETLLASLPQSLDKTYERMLLNISEESKEDARRILAFLCCAKRPLTIPEIIEGIAVELGDNPHLNMDARLDDEDDIHRICPGLIEVDYQSGGEPSTVRITHFSVQEYLESERIRQHPVATFGVRKPEAHAEIACICLTYLLRPPSLMPDSEYPLAQYAANSWYEHYGDGDQDLYPIRHQASRLFQSAAGEFENWVRICAADEYYNEQRGMPSPIYYASLLGLHSIVAELLCEKPSNSLFCGRNFDLVNEQGGEYGTALQAASAKGHEKIVQLLLNKGANVDAGGGVYGTALQAASAKGHEKIVQLLLNKGANVDAGGGMNGTALQAALAKGHDKIAQLLLDKGANGDVRGDAYRSALTTASLGDHKKIIRMLLEWRQY